MGAGRSAGAVAFRARLPPLALAPPPPPPVPPSPPPHPLKARYDWASRTLLGSGQHGIVNLVRVRADGSLVAVKTVIKPAHDHPDRERVLAIIHREATLMKMLPEGTAPALHEVVEDVHAVHLVMEACTGGSLQEYLEARHGANTVPEATAARIFAAAVRAVRKCHAAGVIHRDIKAHNFMLVRPGDVDALRLADYDLSTVCLPGQRLRERTGSPFFLAPEVLRYDYGMAADVWSLGVLLHHMLVGYYPFRGDDIATIFSEISEKPITLLPVRGSRWDLVSPGARALVLSLLTRDEFARATLDEVAEDPWVLGRGPSPEPGPGGRQDPLRSHVARCTESVRGKDGRLTERRACAAIGTRGVRPSEDDAAHRLRRSHSRPNLRPRAGTSRGTSSVIVGRP